MQKSRNWVRGYIDAPRLLEETPPLPVLLAPGLCLDLAPVAALTRAIGVANLDLLRAVVVQERSGLGVHDQQRV